MTELSADKRKAGAAAAAEVRADGAGQDVFARQEELFTVVSAKD